MKRGIFYLVSGVVLLGLVFPLGNMPVASASSNLIVNGDFETPGLSKNWDIFNSSTPGLGWQVNWTSTCSTFGGQSRPADANLELQKIETPYDGAQYAELDTDWEGPQYGGGSEPANVDIWQDISTAQGAWYRVQFAYSPRPGVANNSLEVKWDGGVIFTITRDGTGNSNTVWTVWTRDLPVSGSVTRIEFIETGPGDSLGMFLDGVSVTCLPPTANFAASPTATCVGTPVQFTALSMGNVTSWDWDFGDGNSSATQDPSHSYSAPGTYNVTLNVTGLCGSNETTRNSYITIYENPSVTIEGGLSFCEGSSTTLTANVTGGASPYTYNWTGNGTPNNETFTPDASGTVSVLVTDNHGCQGSDSVTVEKKPIPVADFHASDTTPCVNDVVHFYDDSAGNVTSWDWTFGDGSSSTSQNPSHSYGAPGTYDVSLTVVGECGQDTETKVAYITTEDCGTYNITGYKFGCDGVNCTDERLAGWEIVLSGNASATTTTNASGYYEFTNLPAGNYTVTETVKDGWVNCTPRSINIALGINQNTVVSKAGDTEYWDGGNSTWKPAVAAWQHPSWASVDSAFSSWAQWVWESKYVKHPVAGDVVNFTHQFDIPGVPTGGTLHITTDNGYEVYINGNFVGSAQLGPGWITSNLTETYVNSSGWSTVEIYDLSSYLLPGSNTIDIATANEYMGPLDGQPTGTPTTNPGGLRYELNYDFDVDFCNYCVPPVANFSANRTATCVGIPVQFTDLSTGNVTSWNWSFEGGTPGSATGKGPHTVTYSSPGTYNVSLEVINQCGQDTKDETGYIAVYENPTSNITANPGAEVCQGVDINLHGNPSGGQVPYSHSWSGDTGYLSATNIENPVFNSTMSGAGTYNLTYTMTDAHGCQGSDDIMITVHGSPAVTIEGDLSFCEGSSTTLTANVTGGAPAYTYSWTGNGTANNETFTTNVAGNVSVLVTDNHSCQGSDSVQVTVNEKPTAEAGPNRSISTGGSVAIGGNPTGSGGTGNLTYSWSPAVGLNSTTAANPVASPPSTTTYTVVVTDVNGCSASDSMTVTVTAPPGGGGDASHGGVDICWFKVDMLGKVTTVNITCGTYSMVVGSYLISDPSGVNFMELDSGVRVSCNRSDCTLCGRAPSVVVMSPSLNPPPAPENMEIIGQVYNFTGYFTSYYNYSSMFCDSVLFGDPIGVVLGYNPDDLPQATTGLAIAYYDYGQNSWINLPPNVGRVAEIGEATALVNHFSTMAVLADLSLSPATFATSELSIVPEQVKPGGIVTITAYVTNDGGQEGSTVVELMVNGEVVDSQEVTLSAGQSQQVSFTFSGTDAGQYDVEVAGLSGEFTVLPGGGFNWLWIVIGIVVAGGLAAWAIITGRKKSATT